MPKAHVEFIIAAADTEGIRPGDLMTYDGEPFKVVKVTNSVLTARDLNRWELAWFRLTKFFTNLWPRRF